LHRRVENSERLIGQQIEDGPVNATPTEGPCGHRLWRFFGTIYDLLPGAALSPHIISTLLSGICAILRL
jgi:hypothetical protein